MNQGETKPEFPRRGSSNSSRSETPLKDVARRLEEQMLASGAMSPPPKQFHIPARVRTNAVSPSKSCSPFNSTVDEVGTTSHNTTQSTVIQQQQSLTTCTNVIKEEFVSVKEKVKILEKKVGLWYRCNQKCHLT